MNPKYRPSRHVYVNGTKTQFDLVSGDTVRHSVFKGGVVEKVRNGVVYVVFAQREAKDTDPLNIPIHSVRACTPSSLTLVRKAI